MSSRDSCSEDLLVSEYLTNELSWHVDQKQNAMFDNRKQVNAARCVLSFFR
jgi:hypothetical protein